MTAEASRWSDNSQLQFGDFRLLPQAGVLLRGDEILRIGSRAFELLSTLVEHAGEVVSHDELMMRAWPTTTVSEDNLKVQISALRRLLGGDGGSVQIVNAPGRGYRLVGEVAAGVTTLAPSRLPRVTTRLIGRDESLAAITARLSSERLVTIVGAAGIGKTTLATAAARAETSLESVFVDLSGLNSGEALAPMLAGVLGFPVASADARPELVNHFRRRASLLILDNCEHILEASAAFAAELLEATDVLRILATSREPLRLPGEWIFRLTPLGTPPVPMKEEADVMSFPAVELFVDRVMAQADGFQFESEDWSAVADVCRKLDGIPLAIELAAAAMPGMGAANLRADLHHSLEAAVRFRGAPGRQATLHAALDWSYQLLNEDERRMLRRLAVFGGSFTLAAAMTVARDEDASGDLLPVFLALADKSLVAMTMPGSEVRYRLLQMTRDFALAKMDPVEARAARRRHADYQLRRLAEEEDRLQHEERAAGNAVYAAMIDDIRAALDWSLGPEGDVALATRLMVASLLAWFQLSLSWEGRQRAERVLARVGELNDPMAELRLRAVRCIGVTYSQGATPATAATYAELFAQAEALGETTYKIMGQWGLWSADMYAGRFRDGMRRAELCGELARETGQPSDMALATFMLIQPAASIGRLEAAYADANRALALYDAPGGASGLVRVQFEPRMAVRVMRSRIHWIQGRADQAVAEANACLGEAQRSAHVDSQTYAFLDGVALIALLTGELDEAERAIEAHGRLGMEFGLGPRTLAINASMQAALLAARGLAHVSPQTLIASLRDHPENRFPFRFPFLIGPMAQALAEGGRPHEALGALEAVLVGLARDPDNWCRPELIRARGKVRLQLGGRTAQQAAKEDLEQALAMALAQGARAWALRAATDLVELGGCNVTNERLRKVVAGFDEGFSTADYRRAIAVLGSDRS